MRCPANKRFTKDLNAYAGAADFCAVFKAHSDDLYQLAFLLTADHHNAEKCFVAGLEDSVAENRVFKEWAHSWAKRAILRNAIRELKPRPPESPSPRAFPPHISPMSTEGREHFEAGAIVALERFERFVFVMSVLEPYSEHECALLLSCAPWEVREARTRALAQLAGSQSAALPDSAKLALRAEQFTTPADRKMAANQ